MNEVRSYSRRSLLFCFVDRQYPLAEPGHGERSIRLATELVLFPRGRPVLAIEIR